VAALDALVAELSVMRDRVAGQDRDALLGVLQRASAARRNLPARIVRPDHLSELRIPVPDRQGVLAEITSVAADMGISIYDIEIAHSAEGPRGVLILVVDTAEAAHLADAVETRGYRCRAEQLS
jgi:prephenate dehydrogenase